MKTPAPSRLAAAVIMGMAPASDDEEEDDCWLLLLPLEPAAGALVTMAGTTMVDVAVG